MSVGIGMPPFFCVLYKGNTFFADNQEYSIIFLRSDTVSRSSVRPFLCLSQ